MRLTAVALAVACIAHVLFAGWSLSLRAARATTERIAMGVTDDPEVLPADEPDAAPPPPPPPRASSSSTPAASDVAAIAGPIIPGLLPSSTTGGSAGGGAGIQVGNAGAGERASSTTSDGMQREPRVEQPRIRSRAAPEYPRRAREQGIDGRVTLQLLVDATGNVRDVRVLAAEPAGVFDEAARTAALRFTFEPGRVDGKAAATWVRQVIRFELD